MSINLRPDRFDIPGLSPERMDWLEQAFQTVFPADIPKPIDPNEEKQP